MSTLQITSTHQCDGCGETITKHTLGLPEKWAIVNIRKDDRKTKPTHHYTCEGCTEELRRILK